MSDKVAPFSFILLVFPFTVLSTADAPCGAPAWTANGLLNSIDDLTIPCVKKQDSDDNVVVHVKAEENGMFPFNKIHQLGCRTIVRSCSSWPDYEK